ncbi:pherophorin-C1 protein precursor [Gracilaria domingensis]|nr:pherophorin-C1 protein precursor [Gracilaria domingensis]
MRDAVYPLYGDHLLADVVDGGADHAVGAAADDAVDRVALRALELESGDVVEPQGRGHAGGGGGGGAEAAAAVGRWTGVGGAVAVAVDAAAAFAHGEGQRWRRRNRPASWGAGEGVRKEWGAGKAVGDGGGGREER